MTSSSIQLLIISLPHHARIAQQYSNQPGLRLLRDLLCKSIVYMSHHSSLLSFLSVTIVQVVRPARCCGQLCCTVADSDCYRQWCASHTLSLYCYYRKSNGRISARPCCLSCIFKRIHTACSHFSQCPF